MCWGWEKAGSLPVSRELSLVGGYFAAMRTAARRRSASLLADSPLASWAGVWCFTGGFVLLGAVHRTGGPARCHPSPWRSARWRDPEPGLPLHHVPVLGAGLRAARQMQGSPELPFLLGSSSSRPSAGASWHLLHCFLTSPSLCSWAPPPRCLLQVRPGLCVSVC